MGGYFVDYINLFLVLNAEAIGYPGLAHSPEDEDRNLESFNQIDGIRLDKEAIGYNAAKRALDKLYLKSMWGKLTE